MMSARVLVAGIGDVFFGDEGFGVEVAKQLARRPPRPGVSVLDPGFGVPQLAFELLDRPRSLVVVDTVNRGERPGTIFLLEPRGRDARGAGAHGMNLDTMLTILCNLGGEPPPMVLIGCQPAFVSERVGLTPVVQRAVPRAVALVETTIARLLDAPAQQPWAAAATQFVS